MDETLRKKKLDYIGYRAEIDANGITNLIKIHPQDYVASQVKGALVRYFDDGMKYAEECAGGCKEGNCNTSIMNEFVLDMAKSAMQIILGREIVERPTGPDMEKVAKLSVGVARMMYNEMMKEFEDGE